MKETNSGIKAAVRSAPTIILVDDEPVVLGLAGMVLTREGFRVLSCTDGHMALDLFRQEPLAVSVIICDFGLPSFGPAALIEQIVADGFIPPPLLVCSGLDNIPDLDRQFPRG